MKKLILVTAGVALFSAASFAQQDTTRRSQSQSQPQQSQQSEQLRNRDDMKGWTAVQQDQIPAELRTTLGGSQYKGWESGTIYKNQAGDTYAVQTMDGTNQKTYYFDKSGKATKKPNKPNN
ncbi:MAG TPA: hypothetical protein VFE50_11305 [Cyclobacteriaceae bacterium]|nr:hypothetical protein [Cyclobacteriaceae bacterium]